MNESNSPEPPLQVLWYTSDLQATRESSLLEFDGKFSIAFDWAATIEDLQQKLRGNSYLAVLVELNATNQEVLQALERIELLERVSLVLVVAADCPTEKICEWSAKLNQPYLIPQVRFEESLRPVLRKIADENRGEDARLAQLAYRATVDPMTGCLRRDEMLQRGEVQFDQAMREGSPLSAIMIDIDHFKRVNDVFGHHIGDRTLGRLGALLKANRRPYDLLGRLGGEEFLALLPGASLDDARAIAERLRARVESYAWEEDSLPHVTISLGVAEAHKGAFTELDALIAEADAALYRAKHNGRNRVETMSLDKPDSCPADNPHDARTSILVVDDSKVYLDELVHLLNDDYHVAATTNPVEALDWARHRSFELIVCDLHMPLMPGHRVLREMKAIQPDCVRFVMSTNGELQSAIRAINEGEVFRYILKPWQDEELLLQVHQALEHRRLVRQLQDTDRETIMVLADAIELRDRHTQGHYLRVGQYSVMVGRALEYAQPRLEKLEFAAWLHDIGKIGIPDRILKKTDPLTPREERLVREHPHLGAELVGSVEHLVSIAPFIRHHHERFDGKGYPDGLKGRAIPEESRIIAIANAYDGLRYRRRNRLPLNHEQALQQLEEYKNTLYDPRLVDLFIKLVMTQPVAS